MRQIDSYLTDLNLPNDVFDHSNQPQLDANRPRGKELSVVAKKNATIKSFVKVNIKLRN